MNLRNNIYILITFLLLLLFTFNLGNFLDITRKPKISDIIVCLGGGYGGRVKKSIDLYSKSYSKENLILLTGDNRNTKEKKLNLEDRRFELLSKNNIPEDDIILNNKLTSTRNEIIYIKKFMIENNYESAIIVSDKPHARRIQLLINILKVENDKKLQFNIVGTDVKWWNSNNYYMTKIGLTYALNEFLKVIYTYIAYGFLEKAGFLKTIKIYTTPLFYFFKKKFDNLIHNYTKEEKKTFLE